MKKLYAGDCEESLLNTSWYSHLIFRRGVLHLVALCAPIRALATDENDCHGVADNTFIQAIEDGLVVTANVARVVIHARVLAWKRLLGIHDNAADFTFTLFHMQSSLLYCIRLTWASIPLDYRMFVQNEVCPGPLIPDSAQMLTYF